MPWKSPKTQIWFSDCYGSRIINAEWTLSPFIEIKIKKFSQKLYIGNDNST